MDLVLRFLLLGLATVLLGMVFTREVRRTFTRFRSRENKQGKELIYRHFPRHKKPLGGGVAIFGTLIIALAAGYFLLRDLPDAQSALWPSVWICLLSGLLFGLIGLIDDWRKVQAARGLSEVTKLALQTACALLITFAIFMVQARLGPNPTPTDVFVPFAGWITLKLLFLPFSILIIVGMANAVNLTDGMDGLAGTSLLLSFLAYLLIGGLLQHQGIPLALPLLLAAALLGFLYYNRPTAKIIMGDTGALGLGAVLGTLAIVSGTEWLLLLIGAPFVINTVSVIVQMSAIKFFRGPVKLLRHQTTEIFRPFLCTPLHHHFQWLTWGPWPVLALYGGITLLSGSLALLASPAKDGAVSAGWFWVAGILLQVGFLVFAGMQKVVRANYFLGLERGESGERMMALYKGLPVEALGMRWFAVEEVTEITESMISDIAAESILWRNISEIEARATLGKIYAEYKMFEQAAAEWEEIPLRNLLLRENIVVQLGKIYYGREELLRAVKLWEQLPSSRLAQAAGLPETIRGAKVRVGHLAARLYRQAHEHAEALALRLERATAASDAEAAEAAETLRTAIPAAEVSAFIAEVEAALRFTQDLRDLLAYEQHKSEGEGEPPAEESPEMYRRMDALLTARREELHETLEWAREKLSAPVGEQAASPMLELARTLQLTPAEIGRALEVTGPLAVREFNRIPKPSRNTVYRVALEGRDPHLPPSLVAKCYEDAQISFFSACYRRERGVLQILQEAGAPASRVYGGHLGAHLAVLFLEDLGQQDLAAALAEVPREDRGRKVALLLRGIETLAAMRVHVMPVLPRISREIDKIVKEVLTPEYYTNSISIALDRILALDRRRLSAAERGGLAAALRPVVNRLLDEPKTFIHFEYTPNNLQMTDDRVVAIDFEQATMGPAAFDLATLLYTPEADPTDGEVADLLAAYHDLLPAAAPPALTVGPDALEAAAIMKLLFYAGSAANFYRKFEDGARLDAMDWYLRTADRLLLHNSDYYDLAETLRRCWQQKPEPKVAS
jgi:phospho-N-acetylmuramoyl-pentapeptide-transferase